MYLTKYVIGAPGRYTHIRHRRTVPAKPDRMVTLQHKYKLQFIFYYQSFIGKYIHY